MFWARLRSSRFSSPALYGLATAALAAITLYAINAQHKFVADQEAQTNADNIGGRVRSWLDNFRLTVQSNPGPDDYFRYVVTLPSGNRVDVVRRRQEFDKYVLIQTALVSNPEDAEKVKKLSKDDAARLQQDMVVEAARARVNFSNMALPFSRVGLERRVPITTSLGEDGLMEAIADMDYTLTLLRATATRGLNARQSR